jgi:hypothetical protein
VARLPNVTGLWQFANAGGPGWVLATPALATLLVLVLALPLRGRFTLAALLAAGVFGFALASVATLQGGRSAISVATLASMLVSILLPLCGLVLAFGDTPSLDSPIARLSLVYWSRLGHLRALRQYGIMRGLKVSGPEGARRPLTVAGTFDAHHPFNVASGATFKLSRRNGTTYFLTAWMGSPRDIIAFRISGEAPPRRLQGRVVSVTSPAGGLRKLHFYVVPQAGQPVPAGFVEEMAHVLEAGKPFLRALDYVRATPFGLRYIHLSGLGLRKRDADLDSLLRWMRELIAVLEPISPAAPTSPGEA